MKQMQAAADIGLCDECQYPTEEFVYLEGGWICKSCLGMGKW